MRQITNDVLIAITQNFSDVNYSVNVATSHEQIIDYKIELEIENFIFIIYISTDEKSFDKNLFTKSSVGFYSDEDKSTSPTLEKINLLEVELKRIMDFYQFKFN